MDIKKKIFKLSILTLVVLLSTTAIAQAAIASPDTLTINTIDAYQSVIETDDQLHIMTFEISYGVNPDQDANQTFIFRLFDGGVEIATATPYAFFNSGYDQGVIGFYFDAQDPDIPAWEAATLELQLVGNAALDWGGDPPSVTNNIWDSFNENKSLVGARVRTIALALETQWGVDLIEPVRSVNKLTENGENYFETTIPNLRLISPELFISTTTSPDIPSGNRTTTYGDDVEDRWTIIGGGTFDMTTIAPLFGTSRNWVSSAAYIIFAIAVLFAVSSKISGPGEIAGRGLRPALFLFGGLMIAGSFMGFMVFEVGLFAGIAGGLAVVLALFWRGSV